MSTHLRIKQHLQDVRDRPDETHIIWFSDVERERMAVESVVKATRHHLFPRKKRVLGAAFWINGKRPRDRAREKIRARFAKRIK